MRLKMIIFVLAAAAFINGCHNSVQAQTPVGLIVLPVGATNFEKLAAYIDGHGFKTGKHHGGFDRQVTFFDTKGNRHAFMTIHDGGTSKVSQISVWGRIKGKKDLAHCFGYEMDRNNLTTLKDHDDWYPLIKTGYKEFLAKVSKE